MTRGITELSTRIDPVGNVPGVMPSGALTSGSQFTLKGMKTLGVDADAYARVIVANALLNLDDVLTR